MSADVARARAVLAALDPIVLAVALVQLGEGRDEDDALIVALGLAVELIAGRRQYRRDLRAASYVISAGMRDMRAERGPWRPRDLSGAAAPLRYPPDRHEVPAFGAT